MNVSKDDADGQLNIGVWRCNLADNCVTLSENVTRILDLPAGFELTIDNISNFYHGNLNGEKIRQAFLAAFNAGGPFFLETEIITAKQKVKRVRTIGFVNIDNGKCTKLFGVIHDITARGY